MRRGFKAEAERMAQKARADLGLEERSPLCPWTYATHLGIRILTFDELDLTGQYRRQLLDIDPDSWSGVTLRQDGKHYVVLNPRHVKSRQASTLMHEIAHIILPHLPGRVDVSVSGMMLLSEYSDDQEQEADWLSAAFLLPREALHHYRVMGWTSAAICERYGVSGPLCEWRLRMTGVDAQLVRSRRSA